jgi:DNA repair protein RadA/Sms
MAKDKIRFVCQSCGAAHAKWQGRCDACGEWNTLVEEAPAASGTGPASKAGPGRRVEFVDLAGVSAPPARMLTGIAELDRVLGGGFVESSAVLVGGDPGIGKSTILLQAAAHMASAGHRTLYISGEEAVAQVRLRARRLGLEGAPLALASATALRDIVATLQAEKQAALVVIDSIQTMWLDTLDSAPGTVAQVRACAAELLRLAKAQGTQLENTALRGVGSENMVGLKMADALQGIDVIVLPSDGEGGTNPLDLNQLLRRFDVRD